MEKTFYADTKNIKKLQDLVKAYNLRFEFLSSEVGGKHYVKISGDVHDMNKFSSSWYQLTTNIIETYRKPSMKVKVKRIFRKAFKNSFIKKVA